MRRIASLFVAILLVLLLVPVTVASADAASPPSVSCQSYIVIDAHTGKELAGKNEDTKIWPASTTKMMTCILAIESGKLDDEVTCGDEVKPFSDQSSLFTGKNGKRLVSGEKVKLKDLVYGMLLVSGNDAAAAAAVYLGGSIEGFADMMNAKAKDLGMDGTHFMTPHGTQNDQHYSTAADMAKLAQYAMQNETFRQVVDTKEYSVPATNKYNKTRELFNTNKLLSSDPADAQYNYGGTIGIKTGLTPTAKGCLVADAVRNNVDLIICIYNDGDAVSGLNRWGIAKKLFDWGFNNFASVDITSKISQVTIPPLTIADQEVTATPVFASGDKQYFTAEKDKVTQIDSAKITASPTWTKKDGSVKKDDEIGTVEYKMDDGTVVATATLKALADAGAEPVSANTDQPDASNVPASPSDPGYEPAKHMKDTSIVAIVIVVVVLLAGVVMLVVMLSRRRKKNAIYNRNARKRRGRNDYYNYRKRF